MNLFTWYGKGLSQEASWVDGKLTRLVSDAEFFVVRKPTFVSVKIRKYLLVASTVLVTGTPMSERVKMVYF